MQKLYTTNDLVKSSGYATPTVNLWASKGYLKPCRVSGKSRTRAQFYSQSELDRLMDAVRECGTRSHMMSLVLNRTLHMARDCNAVNSSELATRCGCCHSTLRKAMARLGYPEGQAIAALEEDIGEVKAMVECVVREGRRRSAGAMLSSRNRPEPAGNITLHIKGLTISLDRKDAEALAEEIIAQI